MLFKRLCVEALSKFTLKHDVILINNNSEKKLIKND